MNIEAKFCKKSQLDLTVQVSCRVWEKGKGHGWCCSLDPLEAHTRQRLGYNVLLGINVYEGRGREQDWVENEVYLWAGPPKLNQWAGSSGESLNLKCILPGKNSQASFSHWRQVTLPWKGFDLQTWGVGITSLSWGRSWRNWQPGTFAGPTLHS